MNITTSRRTFAERQQLIEDHLPLVRFVVSKMHIANAPAGLEFDDLVGHGTLGLIQAVDRFDADQGAQFSSFAITRIRGAVLDALRSLDPIGRPTRRAAKQIDTTFNTLALELGREPTAHEVQETSGIPAHQYWRARSAASITVVPFEMPSEEGSGWTERLSDGSQPVSADIEHADMIRALSTAISALPERERMMLSLYYVEGLTLKDVARALDISETRVSQIMHRAYARLRQDPGLASAA
jgi:RNA polymerase sigma factor for flagellar operon FliA